MIATLVHSQGAARLGRLAPLRQQVGCSLVGVNCGGSCQPCVTGTECTVGTDCTSGGEATNRCVGDAGRIADGFGQLHAALERVTGEVKNFESA